MPLWKETRRRNVHEDSLPEIHNDPALGGVRRATNAAALSNLIDMALVNIPNIRKLHSRPRRSA